MALGVISFRRSHKFISLFVLGIVLGSSFAYLKHGGEKGGVRYVFAEVRRGTLVSSVLGTGQVLSLQEIEVRPSVSANVLFVGAKTGEYMKQGTLIARLDSAEAELTIREAEMDLEAARLFLEKLFAPPDEVLLLRAEHALRAAEEAKQQAEENIPKSHEDAFRIASNVFLEVPDIITGLQDILFSNSISGGGVWNIDSYYSVFPNDDLRASVLRQEVREAHERARAAYDKALFHFKFISRDSSNEEIRKFVSDTEEVTTLVSRAVASVIHYIKLYQSESVRIGRALHPTSEVHLALLSAFLDRTNAHASNFFASRRAISESENILLQAERAKEEKRAALDALQDGPEELEIRRRELAVREREEALREAKERMLGYEIRAPFDGVLAKLRVRDGDEISAGEPIAIFSTRQKIVEIFLSEEDIAEVRIGQKAEVTLDAFPDLQIAGEVAEIDVIGKPVRGEVRYYVKIAFDTDDMRVRPSMRARASLVTQTKKEVLLLPTSAVRLDGLISYVEIPNEEHSFARRAANVLGIALPTSFRRQNVQLGLSNNEFTEIFDGLEEGEKVLGQRVFVRNLK